MCIGTMMSIYEKCEGGIDRLIDFLKKKLGLGSQINVEEKIIETDQPENDSLMTINNAGIDNNDDVATIESSLLFNNTWYRDTYGYGEYLNVAEHYLYTGWKEGKDPSPFFSTAKYLTDNPDVAASGVNPLLHFEKIGCSEGRYGQQIDEVRQEILAANPECRSSIEDGVMRLRITNVCNAKCRYCGVRLGFGDENKNSMNPVWYYDYCRPLYDKLKIVLITGGDAFVARESYNYMKFMSDHYPQITLMTESNGIAFNDKFRQLACDNLFKTHFSINASNAEVFEKSCWEGKGGDKAFSKLMNNICSYMELLESKGLLCFAPSISMVINKDNVEDVMAFIKMGIQMKVSQVVLFFDYTENDMNSEHFGFPEITRPVLRMLMEIERVLAGKFAIYFRLWIPNKESEVMQVEVESIPIKELQEKYKCLLAMVKDRSMFEEHQQRNHWRELKGKKLMSFKEDFSPTLQLQERIGQEICFAPWNELDLYPNGRLDFCGWFASTLNLHSYIKNESVDWEEILNSFEYMAARKRILHGIFKGCQSCCPMNSCKNPITPVHKYGYDRC